MEDPDTPLPGMATDLEGSSQAPEGPWVPTPGSSEVPAPGKVPVSGEAPSDGETQPDPSSGDPPSEQDPDAASDEPGLRECDDGTMVVANAQWAIDALAGCISLHGLLVSGDLDLKPLKSLRRVGLGGVNIGSNVTSLEGLENLEEALRFNVYNSQVRSFYPLVNLRYVEAFEFARNEKDAVFDGLENVRGIRILRIYGNRELYGLGGLNLSGEFEYVVVEDNPQLVDVEALSGIAFVERNFTFASNAAEVLRLTELQRVLGDVIIDSNSAMVALFMPNAVWINRLELRGNQPITASSFERLEELREFALENNAVIRDMPAFPALANVERARIVDNYELRSAAGLSSLIEAVEIDISHNEQLVSIDLGSLQYAEGLFVYRNTTLDPASVSASVSSAFISRNRVAPTQDSLPIDPCPWVQDDYCDGDPLNRAPQYEPETLCRAESDPDCASE